MYYMRCMSGLSSVDHAQKVCSCIQHHNGLHLYRVSPIKLDTAGTHVVANPPPSPPPPRVHA